MGRYRSTSMYRNIHYFSVSGSLGYSTLLEDFDELRTAGGMGAAAAFGYEVRTHGFWLNTGIEMQMLNATSSYGIEGFDRAAYDTQGKQMTYHYTINSADDRQRLVYAGVPLMAGYYKLGFYAGVGAKVAWPLMAKEQSAVSYTTTATYSQYVEDFGDMGNHYLTDYRTSTTEDLEKRLKISVIGEIGYDVMAWARQSIRTEHHGLKIGAYVEYGVSNLLGTGEDRPLYTIDQSNASQVSFTPYYNARSANGHRVVPLYAGVRVSWIFCVRTKHCDCNVRSDK